jgi:hypothetical protein
VCRFHLVLDVQWAVCCNNGRFRCASKYASYLLYATLRCTPCCMQRSIHFQSALSDFNVHPNCTPKTPYIYLNLSNYVLLQKINNVVIVLISYICLFTPSPAASEWQLFATWSRTFFISVDIFVILLQSIGKKKTLRTEKTFAASIRLVSKKYKNWIVQRPVATKTRGVEANLLSPEWIVKTAKMLTTQNSHSFSMSRMGSGTKKPSVSMCLKQVVVKIKFWM